MAIRVGQYGREMDKMNKKSLMAQHKRAVHKSSTMTMEDKYTKPSMVDTMMLAGLKGVKKLRRKGK